MESLRCYYWCHSSIWCYSSIWCFTCCEYHHLAGQRAIPARLYSDLFEHVMLHSPAIAVSSPLAKFQSIHPVPSISG